MNTEPVSAEQVESTRKLGARIRSDLGQAIARVTQAHAAELMGVSASTISRMVADDLDKLCQLLAAAGVQLAPLNAIVMSKEEIEAMELMAYKYLQNRVEITGRRF